MNFQEFVQQNPQCGEAAMCAALALCSTQRAVSVHTLRVLPLGVSSKGCASELETKFCETAKALSNANGQLIKAIRLPGFTDAQREQKQLLEQQALELSAKQSAALIGICRESAMLCEASGSSGHIALVNTAKKATLLAAAGRAAYADICERTPRMSERDLANSILSTATDSVARLYELTDSIYDKASAALRSADGGNRTKDVK